MSDIAFTPAWQPMTLRSWFYWIGISAVSPVLYMVGWLVLEKPDTGYFLPAAVLYLGLVPLAASYLFAPALLYFRAFRQWVPALSRGSWAFCLTGMIAGMLVIVFVFGSWTPLGRVSSFPVANSGWQYEDSWNHVNALWQRPFLQKALWATLFWGATAFILGLISERPRAIPMLLASFALGSCAAMLSYATFEILNVTQYPYHFNPKNLSWPDRIEYLVLRGAADSIGATICGIGLFMTFPPHECAAPKERFGRFVKVAYLSGLAAVFTWHAGAAAAGMIETIFTWSIRLVELPAQVLIHFLALLQTGALWVYLAALGWAFLPADTAQSANWLTPLMI